MPDFSLFEHLPDDDLHVLIIDVHALALVDVLDFSYQVILYASWALQLQYFLRIKRPFRKPVARMDNITGLHL